MPTALATRKGSAVQEHEINAKPVWQTPHDNEHHIHAKPVWHTPLKEMHTRATRLHVAHGETTDVAFGAT